MSSISSWIAPLVGGAAGAFLGSSLLGGMVGVLVGGIGGALLGNLVSGWISPSTPDCGKGPCATPAGTGAMRIPTMEQLIQQNRGVAAESRTANRLQAEVPEGLQAAADQFQSERANGLPPASVAPLGTRPQPQSGLVK